MATAVLVPTGESGKIQWTGSYTDVDDGTTPNDSNYMSQNSIITYAYVTFAMTNVPANASITRFDWVFRLRDTDFDPGSYGILYPTMYVARGPSSYFGPFTTTNSFANYTAAWTSGGPWTKAEVDAMTMYCWGIGAPKGSLNFSNCYCTITYTIVITGPTHYINGTKDYDNINGYDIANGTSWNGVDLYG